MLNRLYIGSNNKTKRLEYDKAIRITSKQFEGFTAFKGVGYWQGKKEKCVIIEIESENKNKVLSLIKNLAKDLNQSAIGLVKIGKMDFIGA